MGKNQSKSSIVVELQQSLRNNGRPLDKRDVHDISAALYPGSAFDRESFLANMGDDPKFIKEICELFMSCYPLVMIQLREAIRDSHSARSQAAAHQLRGMVASFAARPAVELLRKIEELAKNGELQSIQQLYYDLELQMSRLKVALAGVILKPSSTALQAAPSDEKAL
jgi:HPt (histidine-containing phosphotransfer) domain-containing protein